MKKILKHLSRLMIWRYKPRIVAVTGSAGKTSAIEAIRAVLSHCATPEKKCPKVRISKGVIHHSSLAVPLAILGEWSDEESMLALPLRLTFSRKIKKIIFGLKIIFSGLRKIFVSKDPDYPGVLVLEYGARHPKDMKYLLDIARPEMAVVTAIGKIPAHVEFWSSPDSLVKEKAKVIEQLSASGFAVLNFDDDAVIRLKERTRAKIVTFGFSEGADLRIINFENRTEEGRPFGISFKLGYGGSFVPVIIDNVFGRAEAYAASVAAGIGIIFDLNLVEISEALSKNYKPGSNAMTLQPGIKNTIILNSSSNASPASVEEALHILRDLPGVRKIAVLGDMLELGKYTIEAHESIGKLAAQTADILIAVGPRSKFIAEGAIDAGLPKAKVLSYDTVSEAGRALQDLMRKGDLILVKASKEMGLCEVVNEIKVAPIV